MLCYLHEGGETHPLVASAARDQLNRPGTLGTCRPQELLVEAPSIKRVGRALLLNLKFLSLNR